MSNETTDDPEPSVSAGAATATETSALHAVEVHPLPHAGHKPAGARTWVVRGIAIVAILVILAMGIPAVIQAFTTISTDDAYVNGHATFVAARVPGQVAAVLVDDNNRVRKGDPLVRLDKEPYQVQVNIKNAAYATAEDDLVAARAQVRAIEAQARSYRWKLQHAMEDVDNQVAALKINVAILDSAHSVQKRAQDDYNNAVQPAKTGAVSAEELGRRKQVLAVADAQVQQALEGVYQIRVSLGLPADPGLGKKLTDVRADLNQTFSSVRQAQFELLQVALQLGIQNRFDVTPKEMLDEFLKRDPEGNIDRIYAGLLKDAPAVKQAEGKLEQARRDLQQAELNLRYCDVVAEIDGVVTRRNVNRGNNVVAGQELMVIRSLREIWVDANFKETELADLRIGQPVDLHLDMYGKKKVFKGRISGFTMGTGTTLALLPAQNATGNFVKVVQRLPVRIDIENYDPEHDPLFVGLSVEPRVHFRETPTGPDAGKVLQPYLTLPVAPATQPAPSPSSTEPATLPAPASQPATTQGSIP